MSTFSEKCREYLLDEGSNVYQFSQTSGLDRTTLQRMVTGKRLPGADFVKSFSKFLRINVFQEKELFELYNIEKLGPAVYNNRKCILSILKSIKELDESCYASSLSQMRRQYYYMNMDIMVENRITDILEGYFSSDLSVEIYTNLPPNCADFFYILKRLHLKYGKTLPVRHIFDLKSNPSASENVNINLEVLYSLFPMALSDYKHYYSYYYYSKASLKEKNMLIYPYYIVTDASVYLMSADLSSIMSQTDPSFVESYKRTFLSMLELSRPLLNTTRNPAELTALHAGQYQSANIPCYLLQAQPFLQAMLNSGKLLDEVIPDEYKEKNVLLNFADEQRRQFFTQKGTCNNFFLAEGLEYFVKTGKLSGRAGAYPFFFTIRQRVDMLEHLLNINGTNYVPYMLKKSFLCSHNINLGLYSDLNIQLFLLTKDKKFYHTSLAESSIGDAFHDFFRSLAETDFVYTNNEMISIIKKNIQDLKRM